MHNPCASQPARHPSAAVNEIFATFGLLNWKPLVGVLLLPPVPMLALILLAWRLRGRRPLAATLLLGMSLLALWFSQCQAIGQWLERPLATGPTLSPSRLADLRRSLAGHKPVVLVLGGGTQALAPEYGEAHLPDRSFQRLHYGLWLSKQLQLPLMVSGGAGLAQAAGPSEADVAARIAQRDYGRNLRWLENESRDTRENARRSLQLLKPEGITDVLLVTHGWHMRRALRDFEQEAARAGMTLRITPAPMGMATDSDDPVLRWMPSPDGFRRVHQALREMLGLLAGA